MQIGPKAKNTIVIEPMHARLLINFTLGWLLKGPVTVVYPLAVVRAPEAKGKIPEELATTSDPRTAADANAYRQLHEMELLGYFKLEPVKAQSSKQTGAQIAKKIHVTDLGFTALATLITTGRSDADIDISLLSDPDKIDSYQRKSHLDMMVQFIARMSGIGIETHVELCKNRDDQADEITLAGPCVMKGEAALLCSPRLTINHGCSVSEFEQALTRLGTAQQTAAGLGMVAHLNHRNVSIDDSTAADE